MLQCQGQSVQTLLCIFACFLHSAIHARSILRNVLCTKSRYAMAPPSPRICMEVQAWRQLDSAHPMSMSSNDAAR